MTQDCLLGNWVGLSYTIGLVLDKSYKIPHMEGGYLHTSRSEDNTEVGTILF